MSGTNPKNLRVLGPAVVLVLAGIGIWQLAAKGSAALAADILPGAAGGPFQVREWEEDPWFPRPQRVTEEEAQSILTELNGMAPTYPIEAEVELRIRDAKEPMGSKDDPRVTYRVACRSAEDWTVGTEVAGQKKPGEPAGRESLESLHLTKGRWGDAQFSKLPWAPRGFRTAISGPGAVGDPLHAPLSILESKHLLGVEDEGRTVVFVLRPSVPEIQRVLMWVSRETGLVQRTLSWIPGPEPHDHSHGNTPEKKKAKRSLLIVKQRLVRTFDGGEAASKAPDVAAMIAVAPAEFELGTENVLRKK